jgi:hypothetical protein
MFLIIIIIVFVVLFSFASFYFAYGMLKPYLKSATERAKVIKYALIFFILGIVMYTLAKYLMRGSDYFEQGIDQLHNSSYINAKIGDFDSYSWNRDKLIANPESPAKFQVEINSDSTKLFLTCTMIKLKDSWKLTRIHQDSVSKR